MHAATLQRLKAAIITSMVLGLTACASPVSRDAITVKLEGLKTNPHSVSVATQGGTETSAMTGTHLSDQELKAAIEASIAKSELFQSVVQGKDGDYLLTVTVTRMDRPMFGLDLTVEMEAGWALSKVSDKSVVMRKVVKSSFTATFSDAFAAVTRLRLAVEGVTRKNIEEGLKAVSEANL